MKFEQAPETTVVPSWKILVCKAGTPISFVCICEQYIGLFTHWYGGHTVACFQEQGCKACDAGSRREFKAYIPGEPKDGGDRCLIQLTHTCTLALHSFLWREEGILGLKIKLERAGKADTSMLQISTHGFQQVLRPIEANTISRMLGRVFAKNEGKVYEVTHTPPAAA